MNTRILVGAVTVVALSVSLISSSVSTTWAAVIGSGSVQ